MEKQSGFPQLDPLTGCCIYLAAAGKELLFVRSSTLNHVDQCLFVNSHCQLKHKVGFISEQQEET